MAYLAPLKLFSAPVRTSTVVIFLAGLVAFPVTVLAPLKDKGVVTILWSIQLALEFRSLVFPSFN